MRTSYVGWVDVFRFAYAQGERVMGIDYKWLTAMTMLRANMSEHPPVLTREELMKLFVTKIGLSEEDAKQLLDPDGVG